MSLRCLTDNTRALKRWVYGLLHAQVRGPSCTSLCGDSRQTLTNQIISWADETQLLFSVLWPLRMIEPVRGVSLRACTWDPALADSSAEICIAHWLIQQTTYRRMTCVRIRFAPKHLKGVAGLIIEVKHSHTGHVLKRFRLELLDKVRTQLLRLEGAQPESQRLWVYSGSQNYQADIIAQSNESVTPELTIPASSISALLPEFKTKVSWHLLVGPQEFLLSRKMISLGNKAVAINGNPLCLKDPHLFSTPGQYQLVCRVAGIEMARFSFEIIDRCKWLQGLKLQQVCLYAETVSGGSELENGALIWQKHVAFSPRLELAAPAPAPNETVACRVALRHRRAILQSQEFLVRFDQATKYIVLNRFSLQQLAPSTQGKHLRLELDVHLENECHVTWPIIVAPYHRISNFEGQLTSNARELAVDVDAYRDILSRLG